MLHMINYLMSIRVGNNRPDRLLYCAPTDAAVDEAVRQLLIFREKLSETRRFNGKFELNDFLFWYFPLLSLVFI